MWIFQAIEHPHEIETLETYQVWDVLWILGVFGSYMYQAYLLVSTCVFVEPGIILYSMTLTLTLSLTNIESGEWEGCWQFTT